jgi:hypothetical protein
MHQAPRVAVQSEKMTKQQEEIQQIIDKQKAKILEKDKGKKRKSDGRPPIGNFNFRF